MSKRSKNHHIVPKVLQKQFTVDANKIWFSEKTDDGTFKAPELRNIKKTFSKKDYYTVLVDGKRSDIVEREFYGKIDDFWGRIIPKALEAFAKQQTPNFSTRDQRSIKDAILQMAKRTPAFVKDHDDVKSGIQYVESILFKLRKGFDYDRIASFEADLLNTGRLRDYGRDLRVRASLSDSNKITTPLQELSIKWAVIKSRHSYILSDKITYWAGNGDHNGLINLNLEIWMPISPSIAIILTRDEENNMPQQLEDSRDHVRLINEYAMRSSNQIGSHSKELIESLTGKKSVDFITV